jgi:hypothetical protein
MRHGDREILVRHQDRPRQFCVARPAAGKCLDDGRKIGPRIGEEEVDAVLGKRSQEDIGRNRSARGALLLVHHA